MKEIHPGLENEDCLASVCFYISSILLHTIRNKVPQCPSAVMGTQYLNRGPSSGRDIKLRSRAARSQAKTPVLIQRGVFLGLQTLFAQIGFFSRLASLIITYICINNL